MDRIHIEKEIEEIRTPELFLAYHPNSHVFSRHYYVTQEELQQRTCKLHFHPGEIICMSRFTEATKSEVTSLIADGLSLHIQEIMDWGKRDPFHALEICAFYDHPIGDGVVKGTDWNHLFALSGICIVLQLSDRKDHFFEITTAYPIPDFDEVDEILDAMDEYQITRIKSAGWKKGTCSRLFLFVLRILTFFIKSSMIVIRVFYMLYAEAGYTTPTHPVSGFLYV